MNAAVPRSKEIDTSRLTQLVGYATTRAALELRKAFARQMAPLDVKVAEFSILTLVGANPYVNQRQLGQALDISAPNMAVTLDRMAERGWIERVRSTEDRRSQQIHLLPAGRVLILRAEKLAATMEDAALRRLSPAERALLIELLLKIGAGGSTRR
jgi:DNA-binding MarR family transcriptional regulator